jgi:hypothetical protein
MAYIVRVKLNSDLWKEPIKAEVDTIESAIKIAVRKNLPWIHDSAMRYYEFIPKTQNKVNNNGSILFSGKITNMEDKVSLLVTPLS